MANPTLKLAKDITATIEDSDVVGSEVISVLEIIKFAYLQEIYTPTLKEKPDATG